jgi:hypothetical protein
VRFDREMGNRPLPWFSIMRAIMEKLYQNKDALEA